MGALIVALYVYASLSNNSSLWGFNLLKFYPVWLRFLALTLAAGALIISVVKHQNLEKTDKQSPGQTPEKTMSYWIPAAIGILLTVSFFAFPSVTTFLGDGHLRTNQLRFGHWFLATEPLDFLVHAGVYRLILHPLGYQPIVSYQIVSAISGAVFLIGIWRFSKAVRRESTLSIQSLSLMVLLSSSGALALFFGYVESYSILLSLLPHVIVSAINTLDGRSGAYSFIALFALASLTHTLGAILLAPLAFFVLMTASERKPFPILAGKASRILSVTIGLGALLLVILATFRVANVDRYILQVFPTTSSTPAILTFRHWLNITNWLLLTALPVLPLLPNVFRRLKRRTIWDNKRVLVGVWLAIPALLFLLLFVPQLTGPRDWDLFAIPCYILFLSSVLIVVSEEHSFSIRPLIGPIAISWILLVALVGINHSVVRSTDRFADILHHTGERNLFKEYNLLSAYAKDHREIVNRRLEFLESAWAQPPYLKRDSVLTLNKLGDEYTKRGNYSRAHDMLQLSLKVDNSNLYTYHFLANLYHVSGKTQKISELAQYLATALPDNARGQMDAGQMFAESGNMAKAGKYFTRAYTLDSSDIFIVVNYGVYMLRTRRFTRARELLERATREKPDYFTARYNLALTYLSLNDKNAAKESFLQAEALARTPDERQQILSVQRLFR